MSDDDKPLDRGLLLALGLAVVGAGVLAYLLAPLMSSDSGTDSFTTFTGVLVFLLIVAGVAYGVKKKY